MLTQKVDQKRRELKMTIDEAAKMIGVSRMTYIRWINYGFSPNKRNLNRLCEFVKDEEFKNEEEQ